MTSSGTSTAAPTRPSGKSRKIASTVIAAAPSASENRKLSMSARGSCGKIVEIALGVKRDSFGAAAKPRRPEGCVLRSSISHSPQRTQYGVAGTSCSRRGHLIVAGVSLICGRECKPLSGSLSTPQTDHRVTGLSADRRVEELDGMNSRKRPAGAPERGRDLDQAAGVPAGVDVGAGREHVGGLAVAERSRRVGLDEVVDPG